ncbi:MAG: 30S ribosomal protein S8e [Candidatus Diapherotrites archaeon]|nr:30S ribosomal protein S8e [Candidatus Diapherotrites archaeon]
MTEWHLKSKKKMTGGIRHSRNRCDKKRSWMGGPAALTQIAEKEDNKVLKGRGKTTKVKLTKTSFVLVSENGKTFKAKVVNVKENSADRHFARRQIMTKGALIEIEVNGEKRLAKVTSRPGQQGEVQAVPVSEKTETTPKKASKAKKAQKRA